MPGFPPAASWAVWTGPEPPEPPIGCLGNPARPARHPGFCREGRRVCWLSRWRRRRRGRCPHFSHCLAGSLPQLPSPPQLPARVHGKHSSLSQPFRARDSEPERPSVGRGGGAEGGRENCYEGGARGEPRGGAEVKDAGREARSRECSRGTRH